MLNVQAALCWHHLALEMLLKLFKRPRLEPILEPSILEPPEIVFKDRPPKTTTRTKRYHVALLQRDGALNVGPIGGAIASCVDSRNPYIEGCLLALGHRKVPSSSAPNCEPGRRHLNKPGSWKRVYRTELRIQVDLLQCPESRDET
jgi:hypothetical protein